MNKVAFALTVIALCTFAGCKKNDANDAQAQVAAVDTSAAEKQFESAPPEVKSDLDQALAAVKSGDYTGALSKLQALAQNAKVTPEQQQTIKDLIAKVQQSLSQGATDAAAGAEKAMEKMKGAVSQ